MKFKQPKKIKELLKNYKGTWMIAGGWAIDLFLGKETRKHDDIEIAIPRIEQKSMKLYLKNWDLEYIESDKAVKWNNEVYLKLPIHEIQGTYKDNNIEILLNEIENKKWKFRRNLEIEYPVENTIKNTSYNIPILCPEIVLLYKSKSYRNKDEKDLLNTIGNMDNKRLNWLSNAIKKTHGTNHKWVSIIEEHSIQQCV